MHLSPLEARAANSLFSPAVFRILNALGATRALLSEGPQVRGTSMVLVLAPHANKPLFDVGRWFYRVWLSVTQAGLSLCPMSALADDPTTHAWLQQKLGLGSEQRIVNVFRVGASTEPPHARARLPVNELVFEPHARS